MKTARAEVAIERLRILRGLYEDLEMIDWVSYAETEKRNRERLVV